MNRRALLAALFLIAAATFATAVILAAPARADVTDDAFIVTIDGRGITYPTRQYAIDGAHTVCSVLDSGMPLLDVAEQINQSSNLNSGEAGFFTGAAVAAYCPWHLGQITRHGRGAA